MKRQWITVSVIVLFLIAGSLSSALLAQEGRGTGRLKGFVKDSDNNPIEGVTLTLEYVDFNYSLTTTTDKEGKFVFGGLGVGTVKLWAEKAGYAKSGNGFRVSGVQKNPEQHIELKKLDEALKEQNSDDPNSALRNKAKKAEAFFNERKFEDALTLYQDLQKERPELYKVGINIANCYIEMRRFDEAREELKTVLDKILAEIPDPKGNLEVGKIYSSLGDIYMRQDKLQEAEVYFKKSIEIAPNDHALAYNVAEILFVAGRTEEAIKYYDLAIQINPKWSKSYMQRGYAYLNAGDTKKALESFKQFLQLAPDSPDAEGVKEVIKSLN